MAGAPSGDKGRHQHPGPDFDKAEPGAQPHSADEPPIPNDEDLPGTPRPSERENGTEG